MAAALTVHSAVAVAILRVEPNWRRSAEASVEIEVNAPAPPPPSAPPPPEPAPPAPLPAKVTARRAPPRSPTPQPPPAPPPPNREPPPNAQPNAQPNAPPVFGVTMSSVVSGQSGMAVPVGNTTMTRPGPRPPGPVAPLAGHGDKPFAPEPDVYIATPARIVREVNSDEFYPPEARALGIEGSVEASLSIDEKGNVVAVRIVKRAGHGFDEAASRALKQFLYKPALASDGRAVPCRLTWTMTFTMRN